ncbi:MAG: WYL domain-containing transcriptional regulator [Lachnospiraceae bacterium]|nr:WYL domain-containing transcriptional regulator [Lachnospiraceae bacterium]
MREFFVYGFKSRDEYRKKSGRSYDDERRRLESWLGDYMKFRQTPEGKNVFLSIDSRVTRHNPLFKAWKAKSFTDGDITLHFILMDLLATSDRPLTIIEIAEQIDTYLSVFDDPKTFDESTIRKKLKEYAAEGIVCTEKQGKTVCYKGVQSTEALDHCDADMLDFFSETAPCGVIGSFLLDKKKEHQGILAFKHHYITSALDSEILCSLFLAIRGKKTITMESVSRNGGCVSENHVVPLQIMISVQNGRQYLMAYDTGYNRITSFRVDKITSVKTEEESGQFDEHREQFERMKQHLWGVSTQSRSGDRLEHVEFTVRYADDEQHIPKRLEREKRCGTVERIDAHTCRFSADVYDASEVIPWIRTFLCRLTEVHFSDKRLERQFKHDIKEMYALYDLEGGDGS